MENKKNFVRYDFSLEGWKAKHANFKSYYFWKSKFYSEFREKKALQKQERKGLEYHLRKLIEEDQPETEKIRLILALALERKKILKIIKNEKEGKILIFQHRKSKEIFLVRQRNLFFEERDEIFTQFQKFFPSNNLSPG